MQIWWCKIEVRHIFNASALATSTLAPAESVIAVGIDEDESGPIISVCDCGPGIDPDKQHLLFTKYATLGTAPTGGEESLGLGLYLAQRMARRMGSRITYETSPQNGACFILHMLP